MTEPSVFVPEVAKQHDAFVRAIATGVLVSARATFRLDEIIQKLQVLQRRFSKTGTCSSDCTEDNLTLTFHQPAAGCVAKIVQSSRKPNPFLEQSLGGQKKKSHEGSFVGRFPMTDQARQSSL